MRSDGNIGLHGWMAGENLEASMAKGKQVRSFDYVNQPYERDRDVLVADAGWVLSAATRAAATRARSMAAELRVNIGGMDVGTEIALTVGRVEVHSATSGR